MPPRPLLTEPEAEEFSAQVRLATSRRRTPKDWRKPNSYRRIPVSLYLSLAELGRRKYRTIVTATWMSGFWDGWTSHKKTRRTPSNKVQFTRRLMEKHFDYNPNSIGDALNDLLAIGYISVEDEAVFSGLKDKNLGRKYRLHWMEQAKGEHCVRVYWGMLISNAFLSLPLETQAVLILLHTIHHRKRNRIQISPNTLEKYRIHRNRLPKHVNLLRKSGLLDHVEGQTYSFTWLDDTGNPKRTKKIRCT